MINGFYNRNEFCLRRLQRTNAKSMSYRKESDTLDEWNQRATYINQNAFRKKESPTDYPDFRLYKKHPNLSNNENAFLSKRPLSCLSKGLTKLKCEITLDIGNPIINQTSRSSLSKQASVEM
jgi:hypothetical protein